MNELTSLHVADAPELLETALRGSKGGESRTPIEAPDSLNSTAIARIVDIWSEGEIEGPPSDNPLKDVYLDETPVMNADGTLNFANVHLDWRPGTPNQSYLPGFPSVQSEIGVGVELQQATPWVRAVTNTALTAIKLRLSTPALSKTNNTNGDISGYRVDYAIDISTDGGPYVEKMWNAFSGKTTSTFERTHRLDLPPATSGWNIRVRRITPNASNSYTQDKLYVQSITEIIDAKLRYPYTALCGIALDSAQFRQIPRRAYRLKGRILKVPTNYNPTTRVYTGVWDGTFKLAWTNNPAWVYYDLATNDRYGLGKRVPESRIDKWSLYKIAQYCDEMVPDGKGGTEPRFACNVYLQRAADAYKVMKDLASVFRGISYWAGGAVVALADQPEDPVYTYTNANVKDGKFVYNGTGRRARHTVAMVAWSNPNQFGRAEVEPVIDEDGIAIYGIHQTNVTAFGCTSQGQAQRVGNWLLMTEQADTDAVTFTPGKDAALVAPGKVVRVVDADRAGRRIGGRVSSIIRNRVPNSENVQSWGWVALTTVSQNVTTAPDGTMTADKVVPNTTNTYHYVDTATYTPADESVISGAVAVKKADWNFVEVNLYHKAGGSAKVLYNFVTKQVTHTAYSRNGVTSKFRVIELADGWVRICIDGMNVGTGATAPRLRVFIGNDSTTLHAGDGVKGMFVWGGQINDGPEALPYVKTGGTPGYGVQVDAFATVAPAVGDTLVCITPSGVAETRAILGVNVADRVVVPTTAFSAEPLAESIWAVESTTLKAQQFRVLGITNNEDGSFGISAIQHNPGKFTAVDNKTKLETQPTTILPSTAMPAPTSVTLTSTERAGEVLTSIQLNADWPSIPGAVHYFIQWQRDDGEWSAPEKVVGSNADLNNAFPGIYWCRVWGVNGYGSSGPFTLGGPLTVADQSKKPGFVDALNADIEAALLVAENAQAAIDGEIVTFWSATPPVIGEAAGQAKRGDIWIETDNANAIYRMIDGAWMPRPNDSMAKALIAASVAQGTADGKVKTFFQTTAPTATGIGDLWFNTSSGVKKMFRWNGTNWNDEIADVTLDQLGGSGMNVLPDWISTPEQPGVPDGVGQVGGTLTRDTAQSFLGVASWKMVSTTGDEYHTFPGFVIPLLPGKKYILSMNVYSSSASGQLQAYLDAANGNNRFVTLSAHGVANAWTRVSAVIDLSSGVTANQWRFRLDNVATAGVTTYVDAIMIEEQVGRKTTPSAYSRGSTAFLVTSRNATFNQEAQPTRANVNDTWFQPSTKIIRVYNGTGWSVIGVDQQDSMLLANCVKDGGFENGALGWTLGTGRLEVSTNVAYRGTRGLVKDPDNSFFQAGCEMFPVDPGETVVGECVIRNLAGNANGTAWLAIWYYDGAGSYVGGGGVKQYTQGVDLGSGWRRVTGSSKAPSNAAFAKVGCEVPPGHTASYWCFDQFRGERTKPVVNAAQNLLSCSNFGGTNGHFAPWALHYNPNLLSGVLRNKRIGLVSGAPWTIAGNVGVLEWYQGDNVYVNTTPAEIRCQTPIPVRPGQRYQAHIKASTHRTSVGIAVAFFDGAGTWLGSATSLPFGRGDVNTNDVWASQVTPTRFLKQAQFAGSASVEGGYDHAGFFCTAPASAHTAYFYIFKVGTESGADCYAWWIKPFFGEAAELQTEPSPWSENAPLNADGLGTGDTFSTVRVDDLHDVYGARRVGTSFKGSRKTLGGARNMRAAQVAGQSAVRSTTALSASSNGSVTVNAHNLDVNGEVVSFNAVTAAVTGLTQGVQYVIYTIDPFLDGGTRTWYAATTVLAAQAAGEGVIMAGNVTIPTSGTSSGGGGGGGPLDSCVLADQIVIERTRGEITAAEVVAGDWVLCYNDDPANPGEEWVRVESNRIAPALSTRIWTDRAEVSASDSTPMPMVDGGLIRIVDVETVVERSEAGVQWVPVVGRESLGLRDVAHIRCQQRCYFARGSGRAFIATHNPTYKP